MKLFFIILCQFQFCAFAWQFDKTKLPDKSKLSPLQYKVTQEEGTESPFKNEYWNNKEPGIYVDIVSGEPLFSSKDKYDSGTGWPSFSKVLVKENILEKEDKSLFSTRTEVRSKFANSHLGHVFNDGPKPSGLRYCMNSAALKFIPANQLVELGYSEFANEFNGAVLKPTEKSSSLEKAIFAGGCFWCMQPPFDELKSKGVTSVLVGYSGGSLPNPTYEATSSGGTGHREVIEVQFDNKKISFKALLNVFWMNIDPYNAKGQFCDNGEQYTSAVFYSNENQKIAYQESLLELEKKGLKKEKVVTTLLPAQTFYKGEDYHQSYYEKNPVRYKFYRYNCGRDKRLKEVWGVSPH